MHATRTTRLTLLFLALLTTLLPRIGAAQMQSAVTTIVLVRHSEKQASASNPSLSPEGRKRAETLAHVLGEMDIDAIYATQFARTKETAQPLADRIGIPVTVVTAAAGYVTEMATMIRAEHTGEDVVVVSHSNTVPGIIAALGATPVPVIDENEDDDLFVVTLSANGGANLLALRYGRESP